jgi:putative membrane fusion protein
MVRSRRDHTKRIKPKGKFYAFIGAVAAAVVIIVVIFNSVNTAVVEMGELQFEREFPVIIVRDEQIIDAENYGKANIIAQEGTRVEADMPVAEVYKWGYNEKISYELLDKQTTIEDYQENALMQDVEDPNLVTMNQSIDAQAKVISEVIKTGVGDLLEEERILKDLMTQKREYLNENVARDRKLEEFFSEEEQLQDRVDSYIEVKTAPQSGVVSYYFDGVEDVLNANNLQEITYSNIEDILNGTTIPHDTQADTGAAPLYRLVNNFKWYILIETSEPMKEFANQNTFQIVFDDFQGKQHEGTVVGHIAEETGYIYVVEVLEDIGELLSARRADARVFTKFEGLKVPEEALRENDGETGVNVVTGNGKEFVPVNVEIIKDGSAIITPLSEGAVLASGQQVEV